MGLALAAIAAATAVGLVFLAGDEGGRGEVAQPAGRAPGIRAQGMLLPRLVMFGDTMRARVDVTLDRRRVDPDSVRVAASFLPWGVVGRPERVQRDAGNTTYLRTTFVLRCLIGPCVPPRNTAPLEFDPARVTYAGQAGEGAARRSIQVEWPVLVVYSRFGASAFDDGEALTLPWRADLVAQPAISYHVAPGLLLGLLLAVGGLLAAAGSVLAYLAWPRRAPAEEPEPEPVPAPVLTPLEHALVLLESADRLDGAGDQRRALELVAEALHERGDGDLARTARELAWSESAPPIETTHAVAVRARSALEEDADGL
jgi:hypothetical protein